MLNRYKGNLNKAIDQYILRKTSRLFSPWVSTKRNEEIKYIREKIIAPAKDVDKLTATLLDYFPVMYRTKDGLLPDMLRQAMKESLIEVSDEKKQDKKENEFHDSKEIELTPYQSDVKKIEKSDSPKKELQKWYEKYYLEILKTLPKAASDSAYLGLLFILLGPAYYAYRDIQLNHAGWRNRLKKLNVTIQLAIWRNAYLVFKPHEEKIYRQKVFEKKLELIEEKYRADTKHIGIDLDQIFKGLSFERKVDTVYVSALSKATDEITNEKLKDYIHAKNQALKQCEELKSAYMEDIKSYTLDEFTLKSLPSTKLSKEQQKLFNDYEKATQIDRQSLYSTSTTYQKILSLSRNKINSIINDVAKDFIHECENAKPSPQFKKSTADYIKKHAQVYFDQYLEKMVYPLKWNTQNIGEITQSIYCRYGMVYQVINHFAKEIKNDQYVENIERINKHYKKFTLDWIKNNPKIVPDIFKNDSKIVDEIIHSEVGYLSPDKIKNTENKNLIDIAIELYIGKSKQRCTDSEKSMALDLLKELLGRGAIISKSPSCLIADKNDIYSLISAWTAIKYSLYNIHTLSDVALNIKIELIKYANDSIKEINNLNGYFSRKKICVADEIRRIDKAFYLHKMLINAFEIQCDDGLFQALSELKCDTHNGNGLVDRISFIEFAKNLDAVIRNRHLFYISPNTDKAIRKLHHSPSLVALWSNTDQKNIKKTDNIPKNLNNIIPIVKNDDKLSNKDTLLTSNQTNTSESNEVKKMTVVL